METPILESKASHLRRNPYTVPEGYFEQLQTRLADCTQTAPKTVTKAKPVLRTVLRRALTFAACFVLLFGFGYGIMYLLPHTSSQMQLTQLAEEDSLYSLYNSYSLYKLTDDTTADLDIPGDDSTPSAEDLIEYLASEGYQITHYLADLE